MEVTSHQSQPSLHPTQRKYFFDWCISFWIFHHHFGHFPNWEFLFTPAIQRIRISVIQDLLRISTFLYRISFSVCENSRVKIFLLCPINIDLYRFILISFCFFLFRFLFGYYQNLCFPCTRKSVKRWGRKGLYQYFYTKSWFTNKKY